MKTVEDTEKVTIPAADIADIRYIKINKDINKTNKRSTLKIKSVNTEKSERVMIYKIGCSFYVLKELILKFKERKRG